MRALAPTAGEGPAKAGMQAAGVRRRRVAGIFDLDRHFQRVVAEPIFDGKRERRRDRPRASARCRAASAARSPPPALRRRKSRPGEAVQPERILHALDPRAVARPADDRIEDRADLVPDRRIAGPQQVAPADAPGPRLGAGQRDRRARPAMRSA